METTRPHPSASSEVPRHQLMALLRERSARLLLLHAPAGFGKTTAMLQFRAQLDEQGVATSWLTLDRADNDVSRLLSKLAAALGRIGIAAQRPGSPHDLVKAIAASHAPFTLFLDDVESVQEPVVLDLVQEILENLPRQACLVIGSRSLPALSLGRMRARGQLVEVGVEALRMSLQETGEFLRLRGHGDLAHEAVALLHAKTEGWGAALWLATMALQRSGDGVDFIARFSGSDRMVADYLAEDVLAQQAAPTREFLLHTSILRQLEPSLCQALCPQLDCQRMLQQLETGNLFLLPAGSTPGQWRYHSLFADFLRERLRQQQPAVLAQLHAAASRWYEAQQRPVPAIDHALEGSDWPRALALLERHGESLLEQGRMRLLWRWFDCIPEGVLRRHPYAHALGIWATLLTRGPGEADRQLAASSCVRSTDLRVQAHLAAIRPQLLAIQDRYQEAYVAGMSSLQEPPSSSSFARSTLFNTMANIFCVLGNAREAQRQLDGARASRGDDTFNRMYTESMEGILDLLAGRLRHAKARFRVAVDATHTVNFNHTHGNAWAGVLYACVAYEANQLERAEHLLNVYLPMAREVGLPDHMILGHVMRARIAYVGGDIDRALHTLAELEDIGYTRKLLRVAVAARLERARLLLLQGSAAAAQEELQRAALEDIWRRERTQRLLAHDLDYLELAQLRWSLQFGDAAATLAPLKRELETARLGGRHRRGVRIELLRAIALHATGQTSAAMDALAAVLRICGQEGYLRTVLDEGPIAAALVRQFARQHADARASEVSDPILADHLDRLVQAFGPAPAAPEPAGPTLPEGLTAKEIRVLELLGEGYSNSGMARALFISDSTVRTHLRNLNQKLGATSRTHAVAIARKLALIR